MNRPSTPSQHNYSAPPGEVTHSVARVSVAEEHATMSHGSLSSSKSINTRQAATLSTLQLTNPSILTNISPNHLYFNNHFLAYILRARSILLTTAVPPAAHDSPCQYIILRTCWLITTSVRWHLTVSEYYISTFSQSPILLVVYTRVCAIGS